MTTIRPACPDDLPQILTIYDDARRYMREQGNPHQWKDGYPSELLLRQNILDGCLYVCTHADRLCGVFYYQEGPDPTYGEIYDGRWLQEGPYGVIHRIAVTAHRKGVASACFAYALSRCPSLRIDTHRDNIPMQRSLAKNGFTRCGIIFLENGEERIAYQKYENTAHCE